MDNETNSSNDNSTLVSKIVRAMGIVGSVAKRGKNDFHRYAYATGEDVLRAAQSALTQCGLCAVPRLEILRDDVVQDSKGRRVRQVIVKVYLAVTDGTSTVTWEGIGEGHDSGDKAYLKAQTSAKKYALANGLLIAFGADPEADRTTDERTYAQPNAPEKPATTARRAQANTLKRLHAAKSELLKARNLLGYTPPEDEQGWTLGICGEAVGREISTTKDLTEPEAQRVIAKIRDLAKVVALEAQDAEAGL